jgi:hypothetical protein
MVDKAKRLPKDRSFIRSDELRNGTLEGQPGVFIPLRLPSYRSLPLSCIEKFEISIDGKAADPAEMRLVLDGISHRIDSFPLKSHLFWWVLEPGDLFVAWPEALPAGEHLVQGIMADVEPYMTVGRFSFFYPAEKRLSVAEEI